MPPAPPAVRAGKREFAAMPDFANAPDLERARADAEAHFWPHSRPAGNVSGKTGLQVVTHGKGVWVIDGEGERWFDTMSGLWLVNIGHGRQEIADAVYRQMLELAFTPNDTVSPATAALSGRLARLSQDEAARVYFVSGGSEANETALKIAKNYHHLNGEPTRWKVLSRRGSYHGATLACTSLGRGGPGGGSVPMHFGPLVPGNIHVAQPAAYRCHMCAGAGACSLECARDVEAGHPARRPGDGRGLHRRAGLGGGGHPHPAPGILADGARDLRPLRRAADRRRGHHRLLPDG